MPTTKPTKGAGTSFWRLKDGTDIEAEADLAVDDNWLVIAKVKDIQPGELTAEDDEDEYLDEEYSEYKTSSSGQKDAGETQVTIAWMPGATDQKQLVTDFDDGLKTWYRIKYPNGSVDCFYGYINSLGKTVTSKDKMQRTVKIKNTAKPKLAEDILA